MADNTAETSHSTESDVVLHYGDEDHKSQNEMEDHAFHDASDNVELHHDDKSGFDDEVEAHYKSDESAALNERGGKRHMGGGNDDEHEDKNDSSFSATPKRPRSAPGDEKHELRILIPVNIAGALIGKGGSNIRELRSEFNANVQLPDSEGYERIMTVITQDLESLANFAGKAAQCLNERMNHVIRPGDEPSLRLLIHKSQAGTIIGIKGLKIKELRETTGAKIKVNQECCPGSTDRICQISGTNDVIIKCVKTVMEVLRSTPPRGHVENYDPSFCDDSYNYGGFNSFDPDCPFDRRGGGRGRGRGGGGFGRMSFRGNYRGGRGGRFDDDYEDYGRRRMGGSGMGRMRYPPDRPMRRGSRMGGGPGPIRRPRYSYNDYDDAGYDGERGGYGNFGDSYNRRNDLHLGSSGGGGYKDNNDDGKKDSTQVTIPTLLAGSIIGVRGQRIRQIRQDSGANIRIEEELPGTKERVITIIGNQDQIQNAQYLLQKSVKLYSGDRY